MSKLSISDAQDWADTHPRAFAWFCEAAMEMARCERMFGMQLLAETYRWEHRTDEDVEDFKMNNNLVAPLSRLVAIAVPEAAGYINIRNATCDELAQKEQSCVL